MNPTSWRLVVLRAEEEPSEVSSAAGKRRIILFFHVLPDITPGRHRIEVPEAILTVWPVAGWRRTILRVPPEP